MWPDVVDDLVCMPTCCHVAAYACANEGLFVLLFLLR